MPKRPIATILTIIVALMLSGCANTVRGVGSDVKKNVTSTGKAIKQVAQ